MPQEVARILLKAPGTEQHWRARSAVVMQAGIDLLPDWAQQFGFHPGAAAAAGMNGAAGPASCWARRCATVLSARGAAPSLSRQ